MREGIIHIIGVGGESCVKDVAVVSTEEIKKGKLSYRT